MRNEQRKIVLQQTMLSACKIREGYKKDAVSRMLEGTGALSLALKLGLIDVVEYNNGTGWLWVVMQIRVNGKTDKREADEQQAWNIFRAQMKAI